MFVQNQANRNFGRFFIFILTSLLLIGFYANFADANPIKTAYKYQEIKAIAKGLKKEQTPEDLEKLVEKSNEFIASHPEYKRVDEVYYLFGNALVQLELVEEGIQAFEELVEKQPDARYVRDCLLELGLAYDKLGKHDKADIAYKTLIDHPKYGSGSHATRAKKILEQEKTDRTGELPKAPGAQPAPGSNPSQWIGQPATDFQVTGLNGEKLSLEKYRGQVVLLDFWATWCGPCIVEIPNVKKTYEKYKDQKFQIIGISLDRSKEPLEAYIEKEGLAWIHYWDNTQKVSRLYKVQAIPSTFLIDGEGVIRKTNLRGHALEHAVADLVKENLAKPADAPTDTPPDTPDGAQNTEPNVKEIINAAVAAHGGLEKLEAVKSLVMESHSFEHFPDGSMQDEGKTKTYFYANRFRSEWNDRNRKGAMLFDGETLYMIADGEVKRLPLEEGKSYVDFFKDSLSREPIWLLPKLLKDDVPVQYLGTEEVKGVPASILLVKQPSGKKLKVFISEETHYVVQFGYDLEIGGGGTENVVVFFDDYQDVDGIKIPYHRATKNGEYRQVLITDIALNAEIDEALFRPEQ